MHSYKNIIRLTLVLGIVSWLTLLITDLIVLFGQVNSIRPGIPEDIRIILLQLFFIALFFYYKFITGRAERVNFIDLLWRVFATGLLATIISLTISLFYHLLDDSKLTENVFLINFFYLVIFGLVTAFLTSTLMVWKQLILYQRSKRLNSLWRMFEYTLLLSILLSFFPLNPIGFLYNTVLLVLLVLGLVLSVNLKWVAYLDFRQKWKSIIIMLAIAIFLIYFFLDLNNFAQQYGHFLPLELQDNLYISALFSFTFIYSLFSLLVILFNLPTSSVFEQKLEEVINFQRLSQSTQAGYKVEQIYEILLESSVKAVFADAAWLEVNDDDKNLLFTKNVPNERVNLLKEQLKDNKDQAEVNRVFPGRLQRKDYLRNRKRHRMLRLPDYRSVLWIPLIVKNINVGTLVILKEVADGFNKEMIGIIHTFASQACISVENFQLLSETLENERYKEELKIANRVQRSLLPKRPISNEAFDIIAFSEAADQVGGDYYDIYQISPQKFMIIIGDVSGKGTSAAFHMSQMKGVFHSLAQLDLAPGKFLEYANSALSRCLERTSFITASFFVVDTDKRTIEFARAGHCPTLFYSVREKHARFLESKGLGLGIIRNEKFNNYIEVNKENYCNGDTVVLYTDGITEATNPQREQFGYERLKCFIEKSADKDPKLIQQLLIQELYSFCQHRSLDDDYTVLIIRFK